MRPWLSLDKLLNNLLPALFKEVFTDWFTKVVKAMMSAWPFLYFPGMPGYTDPRRQYSSLCWVCYMSCWHRKFNSGKHDPCSIKWWTLGFREAIHWVCQDGSRGRSEVSVVRLQEPWLLLFSDGKVQFSVEWTNRKIIDTVEGTCPCLSHRH